MKRNSALVPFSGGQASGGILAAGKENERRLAHRSVQLHDEAVAQRDAPVHSRGEIEVVATESLTPSPVAQSLLWDFISIYMYEWDAPKAERQLQTLAANRDLLQELLQDIDLADLLRPEAVAEVRERLQHTAPQSFKS